MYDIKNDLLKLQDKKYRDIIIKIIPNVNSDLIIGIRTNELRNYAKKMIKENNYTSFLESLPHEFFEENQIHAFIISELKDYDKCILYINSFLPYIDNWATTDQMSPKVLKKDRDKLIYEIKKWIKSKKTYTIRFGIGMLMQHYLDDDFNIEYLDLVASIKSKEYYVNMMIAWFFATSLSKRYNETIKFLEEKRLDKWIHNKTIQKAIESYRIKDNQKEYLRSLKMK